MIGATAAGLLDDAGLVGTGRVRLDTPDLLSGGKLRWKAFFPERPNRSFRRLDRLSQAAILAAEACGLDDLLEDACREETATVLGSRSGCLEADLRFADSLAPGHDVQPAVFPYTLPSTCLGELAIRHRLSGPTLCLSGDPAQAIDEALAMLAAGDAQAALVCLGDVTRADDEPEPRELRVATVLLGPSQHPALPTPAELRSDPLELLATRLRGATP